MREHDVLIVGGGPAGLACAGRLSKAGVDVAVLEKAFYPRDKVCGGWVTPEAFVRLGFTPEEYGNGRVLQPIRSFQLAVMPAPPQLVRFSGVVSYGVLRREFDAFLASRCGSLLYEGVEVRQLGREGDFWIVNEGFRAKHLVGAGGHFCPVAHMEGARSSTGPPVVAQRAEFLLPHPCDCTIVRDTPELFFCADGRGYGWCFRKGDWLNVGFGRADSHEFAAHATRFLEYLERYRGVRPVSRMEGHAYRLAGDRVRAYARNVTLIGDAAGVAHPVSGEGIVPAVKSGIAAAHSIIQGTAFPQSKEGSLPAWVPRPALTVAAAGLLRHSSIARHVLLDHYFLHAA